MDNVDNKQAFALAGEIVQALIKSGSIERGKGNAAKAKRSTFETIKASQSFTAMLEASPRAVQDHQAGLDREFELASRLGSDKAYARGWMIQTLATQAANNNASASKELRDMLQIGTDTDDLVIKLMDYATAPAMCAACGNDPCVAGPAVDGTDTLAALGGGVTEDDLGPDGTAPDDHASPPI